LELASLAESGEECLLGGVEGPLPVSEDTEANREDPILVVTHDLIECIVVAFDDAPQQLSVLGGGGHGKKRTCAIVAK
jgi:hypothetical protein